MLKLVVFIAVSAGLVYLSRACLRAPRAHGFFRFFAAQLVLALVLLNVDRWFQDAFSAHQIISWLLLIVSIFLVVHGAYLLHRVGRPDRRRNGDATLIGIERTTTLVSAGAFKYIRHPLYSSGLFGTWGVFFKDPSWPGGILALGATVFWVITAKVEEAECIRFFGPTYQTYMEQTKMFVPFLL
jgi:protein-S-isoprenylcysteine O-methyltransferase Ste14